MQKKNLLSLVAFAFILSGVCGLVYEVVWAKYLALFIGNTTYAHTVVLATFMGGLAAGAYYWGRKADSVLSRLRLYGILEIAIGLYCFLYPTLLRLLEKAYIYIVVATDSPSNSFLVLALKLLVSIASLFLPTFLMGGTLPILVKFLSRRLDDTGKDVAILYFLNSFGAVLGSFFAGFLLIEAFGLRYSVFIAAIINTIIGIGIYIISMRERKDFETESVSIEKTQVSEPAYSKIQIQIAIATAALSGFSSMVYELTWIRLLSLILGSSTYSFSLMLMAFISGITLGSYIVSKFINRIKNLFTFLGYCELAVGVAMVAVLPIYGRLPYYFWVLGDIVNRTPEGYILFVFIEYLFCFLLMLLPTVFLGMALPIISRIVTNDIKFVGRSVGSVFSINTLGTVGGSLMTGLVFIPWVGVHYSIQLGIVINLILSSLIFIAGSGRLMKRSLAPAIGWGLLVIYVMNIPEWNQSSMAYGVFRSMQKRSAPPSYADFVRMNEQNIVKYYKEGVNATVAVVEQDSQLILTVNGKADASSRGDLMTQLLLGHIPAVLAPKMDNALVIGLGSGITAGAVAQHPVQRLDIVEISPEVKEAAELFAPYNHDILNDPRVRLIIEDAITFLKTTKQTYDAIISEPSNPWIAGIGNLYTEEFFKLAQNRLSRDGMMVQWFHLYEIDNEVLGLVLRTFNRAFPYVTVWSSLRTDVLIVGSSTSTFRSYSEMERLLLDSAVAIDLARIEIKNLPTLLSTQLVSPGVSKKIFPFGFVNTEEFPYLEYEAPKTFFMNKQATILDEFDERYSGKWENLLLQQYLTQRTLQPSEIKDIGLFHGNIRSGNYRLAEQTLKNYLEHYPQDTPALMSYADVLEHRGKRNESFEIWKRLTVADPSNFIARKTYATMLYLKITDESSVFQPTDTVEFSRIVKMGLETWKDSSDTFPVLDAMLNFHEYRYTAALEGFQRVMTIREKNGRGDPLLSDELLLVNAARAAAETNQAVMALSFARQALSINADNAHAVSVLHKMRDQIKINSTSE